MATDGPAPLSAKHKGSFAYDTIKDRLPTILTKVIDTIHRMKNEINTEHGQVGSEELKTLLGALSKLRNELQTDKPCVPLDETVGGDPLVWNAYLDRVRARGGQEPSWFGSAWLYVECYLYRRIHQAVMSTTLLQDLDPFRAQKDQGFVSSQEAIEGLLIYLRTVTERLDSIEGHELRTLFEQFIEVDLWGNKCDLSISAGQDNFQTTSPLAQLDDYRPFVLVDHLTRVWEVLRSANTERPRRVRLDIVLDNSGFELLTDLVLAEFLTSSNLVQSVVIHPKNIPWFVSDVTRRDFDWTLDRLTESRNEAVRHFGKIWKSRVETGQWNVLESPFWTYPNDFSNMATVSPDLYKELGRSDLIIFKGDLNYRKLVGDLQWDTTTSFESALRGFHPAPVCSLRTLKADVVVGLQDGQAEKASKQNSKWMVSGEYAVVQVCDVKLPL